tara:strand:- start:4 stop:339 length:336 start_codon:yes stop_codon:yes gene_type:complete
MRLFVLTFALLFSLSATAEAGGPWSDQYCNIETTTIRVVDQTGNTIEEKTEEIVKCNDGVKDFLFDMGIADSCSVFTWQMPLGQTVVTQRDIACHKMNGEYEIVTGYHSIE